jgi:hypothetical protein
MTTQTNCPQEAAVAKGVRTRSLETSLAAHSIECAVCREIIQVSSWMQPLAENPESNRALPDAGLLWWRARFSEKRANAEEAYDVLEWAESVFAAAISLGLGAWVAWDWNAIQHVIFGTLAGAQLRLNVNSLPLLALPIAALLSVAAILAVYPVVADE